MWVLDDVLEDQNPPLEVKLGNFRQFATSSS
jgi:hypothetical protein